MELLFVRGAANKDVATALGITEQQVANFKFDFLDRLRNAGEEAAAERGRVSGVVCGGA